MLITNFTYLNYLFLLGSYVTKANLESAWRSIEYRITQEAKTTRHLFAAYNNVGDIDRIMQEEQIKTWPNWTCKIFRISILYKKKNWPWANKETGKITSRTVQFYFIDKSVILLF